jgi:predicted enzyme related to lactoylglutathione lyase
MATSVDFFAINADDVPRARKFYEAVFGWTFEPWGPPDFYLIETDRSRAGAIRGALQERRELVPDHKMVGYECTILVENIDSDASRHRGQRRPSRRSEVLHPRAWEPARTSSTAKETWQASGSLKRPRDGHGRSDQRLARRYSEAPDRVGRGHRTGDRGRRVAPSVPRWKTAGHPADHY